MSRASRAAGPCLQAVLLAGLLGGCSFGAVEHRVPLNEADFAPYLQDGTATIVGETSVRMQAGDVSTGAESFVYLVPVTPYSTEWFEHAIVRGQQIRGHDPRSLRVTRVTVVGADGRFEFRNLPSGDYYLNCAVTRAIQPFRLGPMRLASPSTERVEAYARVTLKEGEEARVTVTRPLSP